MYTAPRVPEAAKMSCLTQRECEPRTYVIPPTTGRHPLSGLMWPASALQDRPLQAKGTRLLLARASRSRSNMIVGMAVIGTDYACGAVSVPASMVRRTQVDVGVQH